MKRILQAVVPEIDWRKASVRKVRATRKLLQ